MQPALGRGFADRASERQIHRDLTRCREVGIQALNKLEIRVTLGAQVKVALTVQPYRATNRKIGAFTDQMKLLNAEKLVGNNKTDRAIVANLDILDVSKEIAEVSKNLEFGGFT